MGVITGNHITKEDLEAVKEPCRILAENDILPFKVDEVSDQELLEQIRQFNNV